MGREKNSADERAQPRPKPEEEYLATESRMVQTRYEPDEEYPATENRMKRHIRKYVSDSPSRLYL